VYRYFSLSNLASLLALMSYPFLIEPNAAIVGQAWGWSTVYAGFAVMCAVSGVVFARPAHALPVNKLQSAHVPEGEWVGVSEFLCAGRVNDSEGFRYLDLEI
jgi:hypothetical protein